MFTIEGSRRAHPSSVSVSDLVQMLNNLQSRGYTDNSSSGGGGGTGGDSIYPPLQSLRFGR